ALDALDLAVSGEVGSLSDGERIDLARKSMVIDLNRDGIDIYGQRAESEHGTWTTFDDLKRGATEAGAISQVINAEVDDIQTALENGEKVIVSGTFLNKNPLPWTGDRGVDDFAAPGNATHHFVTISGFDAATNSFVVNDPARNNPMMVSAGKLSYFMQGNAGALSISKN
nr:C39 family peptidase [Anaerolineaceae bacterium]